MSIKLIAVDTDSAFLCVQKTYNRERFMARYRQMEEQRIRFVVVSGNQCYQLISFFPGLANEISFITENGSWVVSEGEDVSGGKLAKGDFYAIVRHLLTRADIDIIACGKNSTYTLKQCNDERKSVPTMYYHHLEFVDNFNNLGDVLFKFGLDISDDRVLQIQADLREATGDIMVPIRTGYDNIDLIIPGVHKANGLRLLQRRWNINNNEIVVFGNGGSDIEMLHQAGLSFAMTNAHKPVIGAAKYHAGSNNEEGVLDIIDRVLKNEASFTH